MCPNGNRTMSDNYQFINVIGISENDQQQLFEAFHRGANVGTRPGTGLGLLLVKRCVALHRGSVELTSKINEGTTVIVRLPIFRNHP